MASHGDVMTCAINRCTITCKTGTWKEYSKCNSCKHINRNIVLFRIRSVIRLLMSSHFYLYSAFNNTDCVKAALQYQIVSVMQKVLNHSGLHKHSQWSWLHWADRSNRNIRERLRDEEMIIVANHSRICWAREHYDQSVLFKNLLNCAQILAGMDVFKFQYQSLYFWQHYTSAVWHWALVYLQRGADVAVGSSEARVTEAVLVQTVSVTSTVVFTSRSDVEVLHRPLCIWMPLIEAEAHRSVNDTGISITHLKIIESSLPYMCKKDYSKQIKRVYSPVWTHHISLTNDSSIGRTQ